MSSIVSESTTHARRPPVVSDPDNNELPSGEVLFPPLHPDNLVQNRDRVFEALRGIDESSINGLRFSLRQGGPLSIRRRYYCLPHRAKETSMQSIYSNYI